MPLELVYDYNFEQRLLMPLAVDSMTHTLPLYTSLLVIAVLLQQPCQMYQTDNDCAASNKCPLCCPQVNYHEECADPWSYPPGSYCYCHLVTVHAYFVQRSDSL